MGGSRALTALGMQPAEAPGSPSYFMRLPYSTDTHANRIRLDPLSCFAMIQNQFNSVLKGSRTEMSSFLFLSFVLFLFFNHNLSFLLRGSKKNP